MLLHEERFRPADKPCRPGVARHYDDLFRLIEQGIGASALQDQTLFEQVAAHRQTFFAQSWVDYSTLRIESLRILPRQDQEPAWRQDYLRMQEEMFGAVPPAFDALLASVRQFKADVTA